MHTCHADNVGSLLRPAYLLEARERHRAGNLGHTAFKVAEDRAVDEAIALQQRAGLDVISDGEQSRDVFASQLVQASDGFGVVSGNAVDWFAMDGTVEHNPVTVGVTGRIRQTRSLSGEEFTYLRAKTDRSTKITLPSPTMYAYYWVSGTSDIAYASQDDYLADVVGILSREVHELVRLGADYIQFDAPEFGMLIDPHQQAWFGAKGFDAGRLIDQGIEMMNAIMDEHDGVTFGLHVCLATTRPASWHEAATTASHGTRSAARTRSDSCSSRRRSIGWLRAVEGRPGGDDRCARARDHETCRTRERQRSDDAHSGGQPVHPTRAPRAQSAVRVRLGCQRQCPGRR